MKRSSRHNWLAYAGLVVLVGVVAILVTIALMPRTSITTGNEATESKRLATFEKTSQEKIAAREQAAADAKLVHVTFPADRPLHVFLAGDSLGAGYFSSTEAKSYRALVVDYLKGHGPVEFTRATKPADAPLFQVGNVEGIPTNGIDLAILELGTNDAGRTDPAVFDQQYRALLQTIKAGSPQVQIICPSVWGSPIPARIALNQKISKACLTDGAKYVDLMKIYAEGKTYGPAGVMTWAGPSDNFHPNDKGHQEIADALIARIKFD
jgi:lysophospholipase L1-like esterase